LKKGAHNLPLHHTRKHASTVNTHNIHQIIQNTKKKNGLSRSRTKEKVGSGAVGGGEIETTEHALVRAIVRHGMLREPRWEAGKRRGEEEGWGRVKCILKERLEREDTRVRIKFVGGSSEVLLLGSRCFERVVAFLKKMRKKGTI